MFGKHDPFYCMSTGWHCLTAVALILYRMYTGPGQMTRTTSVSGERSCQGRRFRLSFRPVRNLDTGVCGIHLDSADAKQ